MNSSSHRKIIFMISVSPSSLCQRCGYETPQSGTSLPGSTDGICGVGFRLSGDCVSFGKFDCFKLTDFFAVCAHLSHRITERLQFNQDVTTLVDTVRLKPPGCGENRLKSYITQVFPSF